LCDGRQGEASGVRCNRCGQNNFDWARQCQHCHAPLETDTASATPSQDQPGQPDPPDDPYRASPEDEEHARRDRFVHTLFAVTPHPFVTWTVMALNVAVFLLMVLNGASIVQPTLETSLQWGASYGPAVTGGEWWRMVTAIFVHAGIFHLFVNMYVLYAMGSLTERLFGNVAYAVLYFLAGLTGSLASLYWHPLISSVGASGAVFGVMGAVLAYAARQRHAVPPSLLRSIASGVGQAVAFNLLLGLATPHVDMAAHVGGLLGGFGFGLLLAGGIDEPASRKWRRAAGVAVAGVLLVIVAARQLPAYNDWVGTVTKADRIERETIARLQKILQNPATDQKARDAVAKSITNEVLPPWVQVRNEIARLSLPPEEHKRAALLVQYMDLRAEAWTLSAEAYRTGDLRLVKESRDKTQAAFAVQARMNGGRAPAQPKDDALDGAIAAQQAAIAWQKQVQQMAAADEKAAAAYNAGVKKVRARTISQLQFAQLVESQVIPQARQAHDAATTFEATTPEIKEQQQRLTEYTRLRLESWTLRAQALRKDSIDLMHEADRKQAEATAAAKSPAKK
jgi:rhomboid protease GluP